jgi:hypothetical protein
MTYLLDGLEKLPRMGKFQKLNRAMVGLVDDYGLVGFETLAVEVSVCPTPVMIVSDFRIKHQ